MKTWKLIVSLLIMATCVSWLHTGLEKHRYTRSKQEFAYLPSANHVRILSAGFTEAAASLLWVRGIIYFGESLMDQKRSIWMEHLIDLVTTADPKFNKAYHFLGTAIQAEDITDNGLAILKKGSEEFPEDWQLSLYYAMNVIDRDKDYVAASKIMERFKDSKKVPKHINTIYLTFHRRALPVEVALKLYLEDYFKQSNKDFQVNMKNKILYFLADSINKKKQKPFFKIFQNFEIGKIPIKELYSSLLNEYHSQSK